MAQKWSFTGQPLWRPGFTSRPGHVQFIVGKVTPEQIFLLSTVAFACHLLSTCMPYSSIYVTDAL